MNLCIQSFHNIEITTHTHSDNGVRNIKGKHGELEMRFPANDLTNANLANDHRKVETLVRPSRFPLMPFSFPTTFPRGSLYSRSCAHISLRPSIYRHFRLYFFFLLYLRTSPVNLNSANTSLSVYDFRAFVPIGRKRNSDEKRSSAE